MIEINLLRNEINKIDRKLLELFKQRMEISKKMGKVKKENSIPIFDPEREREIINIYTENEEILNKKYIEKFFQTLMDISKEIQSE
ncbi:MAG: chorismate mutase [Fusobacterium sp.]|uniref:chorismate mutase n=1 Tax=Fusobacterium sp. TaxID=68766 RepID=UPI0026DBA8A4|nr:chorismate mutase [Fusobacterium sp.]MDO4691103.1 chorismate mutase [Fusobacterium sp.]